MDGKVLFVRYGNFIRRVPVDRVVPAEEYKAEPEEQADPDDVANAERLEDDDFKDMELLAIKDKEIEMLKQCNQEQQNKLEEMLNKSKTVESNENIVHKALPTIYQKIFKRKEIQNG